MKMSTQIPQILVGQDSDDASHQLELTDSKFVRSSYDEAEIKFVLPAGTPSNSDTDGSVSETTDNDVYRLFPDFCVDYVFQVMEYKMQVGPDGPRNTFNYNIMTIIAEYISCKSCGINSMKFSYDIVPNSNFGIVCEICFITENSCEIHGLLNEFNAETQTIECPDCMENERDNYERDNYYHGDEYDQDDDEQYYSDNYEECMINLGYGYCSRYCCC